MSKLAAPLVIAAHVAKLPTLPGWDAADIDLNTGASRPATTVYEGARLARDDARRYVTVGYVAGADGPVVHLEPSHNAQSQSTEVGQLSCELIVAARDIAAARTAVFELLLPWSAWIATDRTLGAVLLPGSELTLSADVALTTNTRSGATASAVVTITYTAVTYG